MEIPACAVGAIVIEADEILLVRRDHEPALGRWSLPGGRVEIGEALSEACAREVMEETSIDIEVEALAGVAERIVRADDGAIEWHYVILNYWAKAKSRDVKAGDDASEARWVPLAEISSMDLTPGLIEFLHDRGALEGRRRR